MIAIALAIAIFLAVFLISPVISVVYTAFSDGHGGLTLSHFFAFFEISLMRESFANSLFVAGMTVLGATLIAIPLAYLTMRFQFRGAVLIQTLGVLPLVMPAFVGAAAMQLIFGRSGAVNLILMDLFGFSIPVMEGLSGIIFVETLHYFPFILLNLSASLATIDSSMDPATSLALPSSSSRSLMILALRSCSTSQICLPLKPICGSLQSDLKTRLAT